MCRRRRVQYPHTSPGSPYASHAPHARHSIDYRFVPTASPTAQPSPLPSLAPTVPMPTVAPLPPPSSVEAEGASSLVLAGAVGGVCGLLALGGAIWHIYRPRSGRSRVKSKRSKTKDATGVVLVVRNGDGNGDVEKDIGTGTGSEPPLPPLAPPRAPPLGPAATSLSHDLDEQSTREQTQSMMRPRPKLTQPP